MSMSVVNRSRCQAALVGVLAAVLGAAPSSLRAQSVPTPTWAQEVNTPPPEGGGFGGPLEVGFFRLKPTQAPPLKRAQDEGFVPPFGLSSPSTRNSASSSSCWFSMYCAITSSVTFPLLQQK